MTEDAFIGILAFCLLTVAGLVLLHATVNHRDTVRDQARLFCWAFIIRFLLSFALYTTPLHDPVIGKGDDTGWKAGDAFVERVDDFGCGPLGLPIVYMGAFSGTNRGYGYVLGTFFYFTRLSSQLSAAALSGFCGALTAVFACRTARIYFSEWVAVKTGWWVCFFPGMIIWSAMSVKEPIVILLEATAFYGCLQLRLNRTSLRHTVLCSVSFLVLLTLRFYAAYIVAAVILVSLALPQFGRRKLTIGPALAVAVALVVPVYFLSGSLQGHSEFFEKQANTKFAGNFRKAVTTGEGSGSGVAQNFDLETNQGMSLALLFGAAHLLLAPFPWQLFGGGSVRMALTLPEMLVWWYLFFMGVVPGLWYTIRHRMGDLMPVLFFLLGLGFVYSIMFGNIGLVYRQRSQLLPYLLSFAAYGIELRRLRRAPVPVRIPWGGEPGYRPDGFIMPAPEASRWRP